MWIHRLARLLLCLMPHVPIMLRILEHVALTVSVLLELLRSYPFFWTNGAELKLIFLGYPNETLTANSTSAAAPRFWKTLQVIKISPFTQDYNWRLHQGFMGAFPQYSRNGFALSTESYGGHYGPIFSEYFETQNSKNIPGAHQISLETVLIGWVLPPSNLHQANGNRNGWYDPILQYQAYYNFTVFPGNTYDYDPYNASVKSLLYNNLYGPGNCMDQIKDCNSRGSDEICQSAVIAYYQVP